MAVRLRSKTNAEDDFLVSTNRVYEGGILSAIEVPPSSGVWCPIVVYDDAVSIGTDKLEVQTPRVVSDLFWAYDGTFVADTRINPTLTGEGAKPVLAISAAATSVEHTTPLTVGSTATYRISLVNPNNYKVQFCSNVEGSGGTIGGTTSGFPANDTTAWVNIERPSGFYLVRSLCSTTDDQTIYIRYERSDGGYSADYRIAPNFPKLAPYNNSGGVSTGVTNAVAPYGANNGVPLLAHVWGMMGNEGIKEQGTYQDDILAIENLAKIPGIGNEAFKCLPWYAVSGNEQQYETSVWNAGTNTGKKQTSYIRYSFTLTKEIMRQYIEYAVRAGIQGFMMLNYRNDAYLSLFRRVFRTLNYNTGEMRGIKICYSLNPGGGTDSDSYDASLISNEWPHGTTYRDTIWQFAEDIVQPWYATARKMVGTGGAALQVPIVYCLISEAGAAETAAKEQAWLDLRRIKQKVLANRGNALGETFNILMTSGPDISVGNADATGEVWNAKTNYYLQPEVSAGFNDSGRILDLAVGGTLENPQGTGVNAANRVPMISWGYDSRPRYNFQNQIVPGHFPYEPAATPNTVLNYMPTLIDKLKVHMDDAPKDLRVALCGQVGEYAEQGRDLFPSLVIGSAASTAMLDIFKSKFNNGYVIPS
jgi:hypothetical protein